MIVSIILCPTTYMQREISLAEEKEPRCENKQLDLSLMFCLLYSVFIFNSLVTEAQQLEFSILNKLGIVHSVGN